MAQCGRLESDGTVTVDLSWTSGGPDTIVQEIVTLAVFGVPESVKEVRLPGPIPPFSPRGTTVTGLIPGAPYAWTVQSVWSDQVLDSAQGSFDTPQAPREPATNLRCSSPA